MAVVHGDQPDILPTDDKGGPLPAEMTSIMRNLLRSEDLQSRGAPPASQRVPEHRIQCWYSSSAKEAVIKVVRKDMITLFRYGSSRVNTISHKDELTPAYVMKSRT